MPRSNPDVKLKNGRNECPACGLLFFSTSAFELHRVGKFGVGADSRDRRRCLTEAEMRVKGMSTTGDGFWIERSMTVGALNRLSSVKEAA